MTREGSKEDDTFYIRRALKRAEEFENNPGKHESAYQAKLANWAGWMVEDGAMPPEVLVEVGRIEDEEIFWETVDWYFEKADHLHIFKPTTEEEIVEDIRRMREEGRPLP